MKVPFLRTVANGVYTPVREIAFKTRDKLKAPRLWACQPTSLQLDRKNCKCQLNCVACNPQNHFIKETGELPFSSINSVVDQLCQRRIRLTWAYPFMNTDPTLDDQLPEVAKLLKKRLHCRTLVSTNGVSFGKRHLLRSRDIDVVAFTICGVDNPSYTTYHRKPFFNQATATLRWLQANKFWKQHLQVRYILYSGNADNLARWQTIFGEFDQEIRPLHSGDNRQVSKALEQQNSLLEFYRKKQITMFIENEIPCNCFHNLSVSFDGRLMQCCDLPYSQNFGHVEEIDVLEAYRKRLDRGLDVEGCRSCTQKNPFWHELFEKYAGW